MFKSVSSWSSAQNITCTPHVPYHPYRRLEALFLWGLVQAKTFQEEFVEEATQCAAPWPFEICGSTPSLLPPGGLNKKPKVLDDFLSLTDYPAFVKRMYREIQQKREQDRTEPDFCRQEAELRRLGLNESCAASTISESGHIEKCVGKT